MATAPIPAILAGYQPPAPPIVSVCQGDPQRQSHSGQETGGPLA
jgi:hypothetical protein